jgi:hypothetical protein
MSIQAPTIEEMIFTEAIREVDFFDWRKRSYMCELSIGYRKEIVALCREINRENLEIVNFNRQVVPPFNYDNFLKRYCFSKTTTVRLRGMMEIKPENLRDSIVYRYIRSANAINGLAAAIAHCSAGIAILSKKEFYERFSKLDSERVLGAQESAFVHFLESRKKLAWHYRNKEQIGLTMLEQDFASRFGRAGKEKSDERFAPMRAAAIAEVKRLIDTQDNEEKFSVAGVAEDVLTHLYDIGFLETPPRVETVARWIKPHIPQEKRRSAGRPPKPKK